MSSARFQNIRSTHESKLHFYMYKWTLWNQNLKHNAIGYCSKENEILRYKFYKACIGLVSQNYKMLRKEIKDLNKSNILCTGVGSLNTATWILASARSVLAGNPGLPLPACLHAKALSPVQLFATQRTVARLAPLSMEFLRQEYWSGWPFPPPGDLPNPGTKLGSFVSCTGRRVLYL